MNTHLTKTQKNARHGRLKLGWGSWIRTNTDRVRVYSSTIKLCPKRAHYMSILSTFQVLIS